MAKKQKAGGPQLGQTERPEFDPAHYFPPDFVPGELFCDAVPAYAPLHLVVPREALMATIEMNRKVLHSQLDKEAPTPELRDALEQRLAQMEAFYQWLREYRHQMVMMAMYPDANPMLDL